MVKGETLKCYNCKKTLTEKEIDIMIKWEDYCKRPLKNDELSCIDCSISERDEEKAPPRNYVTERKIYSKKGT